MGFSKDLAPQDNQGSSTVGHDAGSIELHTSQQTTMHDNHEASGGDDQGALIISPPPATSSPSGQSPQDMDAHQTQDEDMETDTPESSYTAQVDLGLTQGSNNQTQVRSSMSPTPQPDQVPKHVSTLECRSR